MLFRSMLLASMIMMLAGCQMDIQSDTSSNTQTMGASYNQQLRDEEQEPTDGIGEQITKIDCPVGLVSGITLDDEFGPGAANITHCLQKTNKIKVVYKSISPAKMLIAQNLMQSATLATPSMITKSPMA